MIQFPEGILASQKELKCLHKRKRIKKILKIKNWFKYFFPGIPEKTTRQSQKRLINKKSTWKIMTLLYIDTNIFIDAIKNRKNLFGKDIAEPAAKMFFEAISCKFYLAISAWALEQVYMHVSIEETTMLLKMLEKKTKIIKYDDSDRKKANELAPDNFEDAMHVVLAEKSKADFIVTRNLGDFLEIHTIIPIRRPENVL